ncbi:MAG TPA: hypothetical protein VFT72_17425 [Opitutaceae bacterium]|nr:hypothetical protein [Opitutaceae bacterium]
MWRRFKIFSVVVAWLLATGSQWEIMQTVAWAKMIAENARTMSLSAAVSETLSGQKPCSMCKFVAGAQQQEEHSNATVPATETTGKIVLFCYEIPDAVPTQAAVNTWREFDLQALDLLRLAPPTPPPRSCHV